MISSLLFKDEARNDIINAASWYGTGKAGLDEKFLAAIEEASGRIIKQPAIGRIVYKSFRQTLLKKFPYVIVYEVFHDSIIVYAVFHTRQNPKKKLNRLKK